MNLVTTCPWCGEEGVSAQFKDSEGVTWRLIASNGGAEIFKNYYNTDKELEGRAAIEKMMTMLLERAGKGHVAAELWCMPGCGHPTKNPSRIVKLLNRMLHGHAASARGRMQSIEAAS